MAKNLVIVESPAKAKTIEKFLGKDYSVKSSFGHIRDLPKKGLNIDIEKGFEPKYEVSSDKKKVVTELRKAAKDSEVWLASDEDREGAIFTSFEIGNFDTSLPYAYGQDYGFTIDPTTLVKVAVDEKKKALVS